LATIFAVCSALSTGLEYIFDTLNGFRKSPIFQLDRRQDQLADILLSVQQGSSQHYFLLGRDVKKEKMAITRPIIE